MKSIIFFAFALAAFVSCGKLDESEKIAKQTPVNFEGLASTRVLNGMWEAGDKIGIYMVTANALNLSNTIDEAANVAYQANSEAATKSSFSAIDKILFFPLSNDKVDFYAYAPHDEELVDGLFSVNVIDQKNRSSVDLLTACVEDKNMDDSQVSFVFEHQMSMLTLNIKVGNGVESLEGLTTTLKGHSTEAKISLFDNSVSSLSEASDILALTNTSTTSATSSFILIPSEAKAAAQIIFSLGGSNYVWDIPTIAFAQGKNLVYDVTLVNENVEVSAAEIMPWGEGEQVSGTVN